MLYNPCYVITIGSNLFSWKLSCTDFIKERYSVRILLKYMKMDSTLISHFNNNNNNNNKFNRSYISEIKLENLRTFWRICNVLTRNESTFVISVFFEGHSRLRHPPDIFSTIVPSFEISHPFARVQNFYIEICYVAKLEYPLGHRPIFPCTNHGYRYTSWPNIRFRRRMMTNSNNVRVPPVRT